MTEFPLVKEGRIKTYKEYNMVDIELDAPIILFYKVRLKLYN